MPNDLLMGVSMRELQHRAVLDSPRRPSNGRWLQMLIARVRVPEIAQICADAEFKGIDEERRKTMENSRRLRVFLFVLNGVAMLMSGQVSEAQDRSQGRSMVISRNGIVAAESPLAAQAGGRILERGGEGGGGAVSAEPSMGGVEAVEERNRRGLFLVRY